MARPKKTKQDDLPGVTGEGVAPVVIAEIAKAVEKYERKKEARCQASPSEIAAKGELKAVLHANRDKLPKTAEGVPFYRHEGVDYVLEEKLLRRKVDTGGEDDE